MGFEFIDTPSVCPMTFAENGRDSARAPSMIGNEVYYVRFVAISLLV